MKSYKNPTKTILRTSKLVTLALLGAISSTHLPSADASPVSARGLLSGQATSGGRIAFESARSDRSQIYVMNADGSNQTQVTSFNDPDRTTGAIEPRISSDGNKIVFTGLGYPTGKSEIFSVNSDGTGLTRLTNNLNEEWVPTWSPDGTKIAFISDRDGDYDLYVMNADGSNQTQLTKNTYSDFGPATWSPDGSKIAYVSNRTNAQYASNAYVINVDGTNDHRLFPNYTEDQHLLAWSPNGNKMAFRSGNDFIYTINIDGTNLKKLTTGTGVESWPSWSPDGTQIGFGGTGSGFADYAFFKINADGTNLTQVTQAGSNIWTPSWGLGRVQSTSDVPVAYNQRRDVYEEEPISVTLTGFDPNDLPLTYSLVGQPAHGKLTGKAPNLTYTSNVDYTGVDSFTFKVNNGVKNSAVATITLTVQFVDDPPTISSIANQVIDEDSTTTALPFTINDDNPVYWQPVDLSKHIVTASSDNVTLFPQSGIVLGGSLANRTIKLIPAPDQSGVANITVRVEEPKNKLFSTKTFKVTVKPVNDLPTISTITNQTINEDSGSLSLNFVVGDKETAAANLVVTAISFNPDIFNANSIALSGNGAQRSITLLPRPNANGLATITLKVKDETGAITESSFLVTVSPVNDAPVALNQTFTAVVKQPITITLPVVNGDEDELTYEIVSTNILGSLLGQGATREFTASDPGTASFTFRVRGSQGTVSNIGTITINVTAPEGLKVSGYVQSYRPSPSGLTADLVPNTVIRLEQKGQTRYTLTREGGNEYSAFGVAPGDYVARVYSVNGGLFLPFDPLYQAVKVKKGEVFLKPFALYSIYGQVTATVGSGKNKTVVPVAGATIKVSMPVSGLAPITATLTTDAQGTYSMSGFPKGKVTLLVSKAGVTFASKGKYTVSLPSNSKPNKPNARYDIKGTAASNPNSAPKTSIQKS